MVFGQILTSCLSTFSNKDFCKRTYIKDMKFPVKIRDIHKIEKKS